MATRTMQQPALADSRQIVRRPGFWAGMLTTASAAAAMGIAVTTAPPRSGPFCLTIPCIEYPYTAAAAFVPIDYLWMYAAFLIGPAFLVLVACIHHSVVTEKQLYSRIALAFATISAMALASNYYIQLTTMQTSFLQGETADLSLFSQYNPHGIFIALEDLGYLMMGLAFLFCAGALGGTARFERIARFLFAGSGMLAVGALPVLVLLYGHQMEYRYEVIVILINWVALTFLGVLLSLHFARAR